MKLVDKIKNALFEVEYVEVEEKEPKKVTKEKKQVIHEKKEEKPIAKKIVTRDIPRNKKIEKIETYDDNRKDSFKEELVNTMEFQNNFKEPVKEHNFPLVDDSAFNTEDVKKTRKELKEEKKRAKEKIKEQEKIKNNLNNIKDSDNYIASETSNNKDYAVPSSSSTHDSYDYSSNVSSTKRSYYGKDEFQQTSKPYGIENRDIYEPGYGAYEKKEEKGYFHPSPIISPIYGILDKDYKKEDIVTKKEIRLSTGYSRDSLDLDQVRNKAYGNLVSKEDEIDRNLDDDEIRESNFKDNDLLDLSGENDKPSVKKVTVGDALEYFEDLGLEYNVDYKDEAKHKSNDSTISDVKIIDHSFNEEIEEDDSNYVDDNQDEVSEEDNSVIEDSVDPVEEELADMIEKVHESSEELENEMIEAQEDVSSLLEEEIEENSDTSLDPSIDDSDDDDNLFDLIDSMYDNN